MGHVLNACLQGLMPLASLVQLEHVVLWDVGSLPKRKTLECCEASGAFWNSGLHFAV